MQNVIRIRKKNGAPIDNLAKVIVKNLGPRLDKLPEFKLIQGASALLGSGETGIVEIYIRYNQPDQNRLAEIDEILEIANEGADDIIVVTKPHES